MSIVRRIVALLGRRGYLPKPSRDEHVAPWADIEDLKIRTAFRDLYDWTVPRDEACQRFLEAVGGPHPLAAVELRLARAHREQAELAYLDGRPAA